MPFIVKVVILINLWIYIYASEDLRPTTSHETDGKANTRKGSGIAPLVFVYSSHCSFVVIDLNKYIYKRKL